jgi:glutamate-1-semialdehyde 2,1-aminomutase
LTKRENLSAGLVVRPSCSAERVEQLLSENPQIKVLKPYLVYAENVANIEETDIDTFAPEWMWQLANEREMPILLHLSHYKELLSHPANYGQINYFCTKYPKVKLVLAHCAMGHNVEMLRRGLEQIKGLKNIWFDCSGAGEAAAIAYCIRYFGTDRMMYGGDFDYGTLFGRIYSYGSSWHAMRPTPERDKISGYRPINNLQDCLLQLIYAIDAMALTENQVEDIFYNNAKHLYG